MSGASRDKGARGERELVAAYKARGYDCARTPLSGGLQWKGDVLGVPGIHVEAKRTERLRIWEAIDQMLADAGPTDVPALHFRRSRSDWWVAIPFEDFAELLALRDAR